MKNNATAINELETRVYTIGSVYGLEDPLTITAYTLLAIAKRGEMSAVMTYKAFAVLDNARSYALATEAREETLSDEDDLHEYSPEETEFVRKMLELGATVILR